MNELTDKQIQEIVEREQVSADKEDRPVWYPKTKISTKGRYVSAKTRIPCPICVHGMVIDKKTGKLRDCVGCNSLGYLK